MEVGSPQARGWLFLAVILGVGCPGARGPVRPRPLDPAIIPRALLFGNPARARPRLSPDGKQLAWLAPLGGVMNVWVRTVGREDARAVTRGRRRGIRRYGWAPDSRRILYLEDRGGDENHRLFGVDIGTRRVRRYTPDRGVRAGIVTISPRHPHHILISMNRRSRRLFDVFRLDLRSGKTTLVARNPGHVMSWVADGDLQVRAALALDDDGNKLLLGRDSPQGKWRVLRIWTPLESGGPAAFTRDGAAVICVGNKGVETTRVFTLRLADGVVRSIHRDPQVDLAAVEVNPRSHRVEAVAVEYRKKRWKAVDPAFAPHVRALDRIAAGGRWGIVNRTRADDRWIVAVGRDVVPLRYYLYETRSRKARLLFQTRRRLLRYPLAPMTPVVIRARDGLSLVSYLTRPPRPLPGRTPLVLLVHGGPWTRDKWAFHPWVQWLASRGYAVLQVNFRGSTGFGKRFVNAGNREWGGKMQRDLDDAVAWAIRHAGVDPKRVAIMGGSYGGYAALAGLAFTPGRYAAGISIVGPSNLLTLLASIPPYWKPMQAIFRHRLGDPVRDRALLQRRSPLHAAGRIRAPLAIFQGHNDPRVPPRESRQIVSALRRRGRPVLYVVYPDEGHGFRRPANLLDFYGRAEAFLATHLGGRLEPVRPVPGSSAQVR